MNSLFILSVVLAVVSSAYGGAYNTENDEFDMKAAVANIDVLKGLVGCFLDTNPCSPIAAAFLKDFPDAVKTSCVKCNDKQKGLMHVFLDGVKDKLAKEYEEIKNKFDPEHKSFETLLTNIAAY